MHALCIRGHLFFRGCAGRQGSFELLATFHDTQDLGQATWNEHKSTIHAMVHMKNFAHGVHGCCATMAILLFKQYGYIIRVKQKDVLVGVNKEHSL